MEIRSRHDDGRLGWPENGPFDAIIVTAGGPILEPALLAQLKPDGVLVAPVGGGDGQKLLRVRKTAEGIEQEELGAVIFVPLLPGIVT